MMDFPYKAEFDESKQSIIVHRPSYRESKKVSIPMALVDHIKEAGLTVEDIDSALQFVREREKNVQVFKVSELVGKDLRGLTVGYFFSNWEDSAWEYSNNIVTFKKEADGVHYIAVCDDLQNYDVFDSYYFDELSVVKVVMNNLTILPDLPSPNRVG